MPSARRRFRSIRRRASSILALATSAAGPAADGVAFSDRLCGTIGAGNEAHARGFPLAGCTTARRVLGKHLRTRRHHIEKWTCRRGSYAVFVTCTHRRAELVLFDGSYGE